MLLGGCVPEQGFGDAKQKRRLELPEPQGDPADLVVESFTQAPGTDVDILFAVDSSWSMNCPSASLLNDLPVFLEPLERAGVDWHAGVVTMDMADWQNRGRLLTIGSDRWVDAGTDDPEWVLEAMLHARPSIYSTAQGRAAIFTALDTLRYGYNDGFLRPDSRLHIVAITDSVDASTHDPISSGLFGQWLLDAQAVRPELTFTSIVDADPESSDFGRQYIALSRAIGGEVYDIDNAGFRSILEHLGVTGAGLHLAFELEGEPVPGSLVVFVHDDEQTVVLRDSAFAWDEETHSVIFDEAPAPGAVIDIHYVVDDGR